MALRIFSLARSMPCHGVLAFRSTMVTISQRQCSAQQHAVLGRTLTSATVWRMQRVVDDVDFILAPPKPLDRTGETADVTRKRLVYQSRKRGILENDLLLSTFAAKYLPTMTVEEMQMYDRLLDANDWDIYYWVTGKKPVPDEFNHTVMQKLQEYSKNDRGDLLRMPDLPSE